MEKKNLKAASILSHKFYDEQSVFLPENLLREARRQKNKRECNVPSVCLLDPDGDLTDYLLKRHLATPNDCWACYHSTMYSFDLQGKEIGIVPCAVGSSYAVLVAEQLFASGCKLLISVTSAGIIKDPESEKRFVLITSSIRDEGTSYHYLSAEKPARLDLTLLRTLLSQEQNQHCPYLAGLSWTTDAPYRETESAINVMSQQNAICVEMEAAALYALAEAKKYNVVCFAHLTNSMARTNIDFEKGEEFGSIDTLKLIKFLMNVLLRD